VPASSHRLPAVGPETGRGPASYHRVLRTIGLTLSTRHRAPLAPLGFAFVMAVAMLVAPAGPAVRPTFAAAQQVAVAPGVSDPGLVAAESSLAAMINADRAAVGLLPLRVDGQLSAIARGRSTSMAAAGRLSHVQSDGRTVTDLITADGITWYSAGETIGWNDYPSLRDSTNVVNRGWMTSPEHASIVRSTAYNYLGVGLGLTADGDRYWTAIFLRGPDRTSPWARMLAPTAGASATLSSGRQVRLVTWRWTGEDRPLAALTSGLRSFEIQRRVDDGAWVAVGTSTTGYRWASSVWVGRRVQVRVRARDRAGNVGDWSPPVSFSA
jgi:uncharacterized protein YkwD